ncbi:hypothetical protein C9994_17140, partial [Marivirga lumbricoides]
MVERSYELSFRWKTYSIEAEEDEEEEIEDNITAVIAASDLKTAIDNAADKCVADISAMQLSSAEDFCLSTSYLEDELSVSYETGSYHYTLYYYDRAGNLVRTVPPKGVQLLDGNDPASKEALPAHTLTTHYEYNSLGQLVSQRTPDGGITDFIYNNAGQLRFSQNAKQAADNTFS